MRRLNQQSIIKITLHLQWWGIYYCFRFINVREEISDGGYLLRKWVSECTTSSESLAWPFHHFFNNRQGLRVRVPDRKYLPTALLTNKIHVSKISPYSNIPESTGIWPETESISSVSLYIWTLYRRLSRTAAGLLSLSISSLVRVLVPQGEFTAHIGGSHPIHAIILYC